MLINFFLKDWWNKIVKTMAVTIWGYGHHTSFLISDLVSQSNEWHTYTSNEQTLPLLLGRNWVLKINFIEYKSILLLFTHNTMYSF
jgi:hypothetical protein